jgi:choline dehydrogenase-like flavoprotein
MFIDANEVPEATVVETDICIVGAGAAGITIACEFIGTRFRVCVLESGGFASDPKTQGLYRGTNVGHHYYDLDVCRLRYFGGSTNCWGGWCRPLKPVDFKEQPWVPYSGWPFSFENLEPYYRRAQAICQLGPYGYDVSYLKTQIGSELLPLDQGRLVTDVIQFSPPTRFGEVYRLVIKSAANVRTYLSANVTNIETGETPNAVTRLRAETLSGRKFWITAKCYILAAGGLESPRLLLISNAAEKTGLGNRYDLVGRFLLSVRQSDSVRHFRR